MTDEEDHDYGHPDNWADDGRYDADEEKARRISEERETTNSIWNTLHSMEVFQTAEEAGVPHIVDGSVQKKLAKADLVINGTNQFIYFDKQIVNGRAAPLHERHRVLYVGTFNPETGEILDWGQK